MLLQTIFMLKYFCTLDTLMNFCVRVFYHVFPQNFFSFESIGALVAIEVWQLTLPPKRVLNFFIVWEVLDELFLFLVGESLWPSHEEITVDLQSVYSCICGTLQ